jgi:hypothetical protein
MSKSAIESALDGMFSVADQLSAVRRVRDEISALSGLPAHTDNYDYYADRIEGTSLQTAWDEGHPDWQLALHLKRDGTSVATPLIYRADMGGPSDGVVVKIGKSYLDKSSNSRARHVLKENGMEPKTSSHSEIANKSWGNAQGRMPAPEAVTLTSQLAAVIAGGKENVKRHIQS